MATKPDDALKPNGIAGTLQAMTPASLTSANDNSGRVTETTSFLPASPSSPAPAPNLAPEDNRTVEQRLNGLLASDSDYIKMAQAAGTRTAGRRGLVNSSIAAGAAHGAAIERALPIATADAQIAAQKSLAGQDAAAQMARLKESAASQMQQLQTQLAQADESQKREIQAQMERLTASTEAEAARLSQAAGYDMERLHAQAGIDLVRDAAQATNAQDLARVQGVIQSALQSQGNTEQIQRMGVDLSNQLAVTAAQLQNDLSKIAAAGNEDVRRLVEAANQERVTLQQSIAAQDRQQMAQSMVNIFQIEAQLRSALLGNDKISASERTAYERTISAMGDPVRNYVNQLFAPPPAPATGLDPTGSLDTVTTNNGGLLTYPTGETGGNLDNSSDQAVVDLLNQGGIGGLTASRILESRGVNLV